jgi:hypothetical protein
LNYLNPALRRAFAIPPLQNECDGDRVFKLQLLFDNYLGSFRSNKETIRVPCSAFQTIGSEFNVEIEFSTLTLSEVSDRWNDTTVEMYGMMAVSSDQAVGYGGQAELWDGEHWERVRLLSTYPIPQGGIAIENWGDPGKIVKLSNGTHLLHNVPLTEYHPDEVHIIRSRSVGNNKVVVPVHEGESLMLFVGLMDSDEPLNPDAVCITRTRFGPISLTDLAGQDMVYRTGVMPKAEDTNAACQVQMVIRPIGD